MVDYYEPPERGAQQMRGALSMVTAIQLRGWVRRWGIVLPAAILISLFAPSVSVIGWIVGILAGLHLGFILLVRRLLGRGLGFANMPTDEPVDATATRADDDDPPRLIDVTPRRD